MNADSLSKVRITSLFVLLLSFGIGHACAEEGDPIPGVDVSIEQVPSGIIIAKITEEQGGITTTVRSLPERTGKQNYNSSKSNTAGITVDFGQSAGESQAESIDSYIYSFKGLAAGTYIVREVGKPARTVVVEAGGSISGTRRVSERLRHKDRK